MGTVISGGAAFLFAILALIAGYILGYAARTFQTEREIEEAGKQRPTLGQTVGEIRSRDEHVGQEWGEISRDAMATYRRIHEEFGGSEEGWRIATAATPMYEVARDIADDPARRKTTAEAQEIIRRQVEAATRRRVQRPVLVVTSDGLMGGQGAVLDEAGFEAVAGVGPEVVLAALGHEA